MQFHKMLCFRIIGPARTCWARSVSSHWIHAIRYGPTGSLARAYLWQPGAIITWRLKVMEWLLCLSFLETMLTGYSLMGTCFRNQLQYDGLENVHNMCLKKHAKQSRLLMDFYIFFCIACFHLQISSLVRLSAWRFADQSSGRQINLLCTYL